MNNQELKILSNLKFHNKIRFLIYLYWLLLGERYRELAARWVIWQAGKGRKP